MSTTAQDAAPRLLYDRKGAARQLSISIRSLDYLIANKKLVTRRLGKKVLVPYGALVQFARADHFEDMATDPKAVKAEVQSIDRDEDVAA
jgi:hypothetical protein